MSYPEGHNNVAPQAALLLPGTAGWRSTLLLPGSVDPRAAVSLCMLPAGRTKAPNVKNNLKQL